MSEIQKVLNLIRGGGGRKFSKSSEIQKVLNYPRGGGVKPNWEFFPNFPGFFFFSDGSPNQRLFLRLFQDNLQTISRLFLPFVKTSSRLRQE